MPAPRRNDRPATGSTMDLDTLRRRMRNREFDRLYVFYGEEGYLVDGFLTHLARELIHPSALALDRVVLHGDGQPSRLPVSRLEAEVRTIPFLSARRLVIVRDSGYFSRPAGARKETDSPGAQGQEDGGEGEGDPDRKDREAPVQETGQDRSQALAALLGSLPETVCLAFVEKTVDLRLKKLVEAVRNNGVLFESGFQDPGVLRDHVVRTLARDGIAIDSDAADSLVERCGRSLQPIRTEMDKILLYGRASGLQRLTLQELDIIAVPDLHASLFDVTDAIGDGEPGRALDRLDRLVASREPVILLHFQLARHIRRLLAAWSYPDARALETGQRMSPFHAAKVFRQSRRFRPQELETLYIRFAEADRSVKTGRIPDRLALEMLIAEAGSLPAGRRTGR